jgi:hypothetical protein
MSRERQKKVIHKVSIVLGIIGLLMLAAECPAFPYRPAAALSIVSEYTALSSARPHSQVWKVVPETGPDGATLLRFFLEASSEAVVLCELRLPPPGATGGIQWTGAGKSGQKKSNAGILLVPGFPAPCDVLPVDALDNGKVYEEKAEAGGRVFSKSYRVSVVPLSIGEAKAAGWIRVENRGGEGLIMVSVADEAGRLVVKQLWPADGSWWLYEETPLRRSWLVQ